MIRKITLAVFLAGMLASCYYDVESELYPEGCETPEVVSFEQDVQPIVDLNCAISGCHVYGGEGVGLLDTYSGVKAIVDSGDLEFRVFESPDNPMPPTGQLGECDLELILRWINQGALDN
jgi:hypothetical protein